MSDQNYDVIVIGTGPGGEGAAMKAAKEGKSVAVIEKYHLVGGGCTHWGTIPSKALRHLWEQYSPIIQFFLSKVDKCDDPILKRKNMKEDVQTLSLQKNLFLLRCKSLFGDLPSDILPSS